MLQNFKENETFYYLLEVNQLDQGLYANPLGKMWNTNAFTTVSGLANAHKFESKELALKIAKLQNALNEMFESKNKVYVVEAVTQSVIFDDQGTTKELGSFVVEG
ncbi:hypothetical protein GJU84_04915 [Staphylococcus chromogenes]|uniref:Phage protein n=1 Tax=Staphylococcus agnetis TaxID=985762 RepID=A0ABX3Z3T0_9STAP|nr:MULTISPECIES: hypothetical protein [Staphylococcus]ALN76746.1 hypothetical protein EP23_04775 [Staphylococcus agnetis]MDG4942805.1 hypothetical protein [Staphylococcus agnetis]OSP20433.1 hypothetical protein B9L42_05630 [Staphylococcus agnetis]OSP25124.1 hypothetical protein B9M87_00795 [Staphylococcus agnetis]OTW31149.1 hypothetical protein B9M88_06725 [Staphylococcus agnetis]